MRPEARQYRGRLLRPAVQRALLDEHLRRNFMAFTREFFATVVPGEELHLNWHLEAIAFKLDRVMQGEKSTAAITIPPRHLKSIMTTVALPAFVLGHDPTKKIVCVSYSHELATKHAIDCRAVMQSDWYQRLFPMTRIGEKNTEMDFRTTQRGGRFATSVGGTLTGRGGDLFVIDDPQKPDEAMSEASRTRANAWFESTLMSRLNDKQKSAIVMVMQRLHVDDIAGLVLEKGGWSHLDIPAIADEEQTFRLYSGGAQTVSRRPPGSQARTTTCAG